MEGHCNCGTIKVRIEQMGEPVKISLCHCLDCSASGGTLFALNMLVPSHSVKVEAVATKPKTYTTTAASGNTVTRHFCSQCGSPIMTTVLENPNLTFVKGGLFRKSGVSLSRPFKEQWFRRAESWEAPHEFVDMVIP